MSPALGWVRRLDVVAFPLITFVLGWAFYIPAMVLIVGHPERQGWLIFLQTPGAASALVAGLVVRHARSGAPEMKEPGGATFDWRGHCWWWWLAAVLLVPALAALAGLLQGSFGAGMVELWRRLGWFSLLVLPLITAAQLISSPLLEEYGWRGFWQGRLQHRWPAWLAAVVVGLLWGVHHVPIALAMGVDLGTTMAGAVGASVLSAWLLNAGNGSMVGPMLLHASLNVAIGVIAPDTWWLIGLMLAAALLVALVVGPRGFGGHPAVIIAPALARNDDTDRRNGPETA